MSGSRQPRKRPGDGAAKGITHFHKFEPSGIYSCVIILPISGREMPIKPKVQKALASTYFHDDWTEKEACPLIAALLDRDGDRLTAPAVGRLAEYIRSEGLKSSPGARDPESAYWKTILSRDDRWIEYANTFNGGTKTFRDPQPPPINLPILSNFASASVQSLKQKNIPPLDPKYVGKILLRPLGSTFEVMLDDRRSLHLGPQGQKLVFCMLLHMLSEPEDVVQPLMVMIKKTSGSWTAPVIG